MRDQRHPLYSPSLLHTLQVRFQQRSPQAAMMVCGIHGERMQAEGGACWVVANFGGGVRGWQDHVGICYYGVRGESGDDVAGEDKGRG